MARPTAKELFNQEYNGQANIMTPTIVSRRWVTETLAVEVSSGRGFNDRPIFGVTFLGYDGAATKRCNDLSKLCYSLEEANDYIEAVCS